MADGRVSKALPLLSERVGYLWKKGRESALITLLDESEGHGYAAWCVLPPVGGWLEIVQAGLQERVLGFGVLE